MQIVSKGNKLVKVFSWKSKNKNIILYYILAEAMVVTAIFELY